MQKVIKRQRSPLFVMAFPGMGKTYFTSKSSLIENLKVYDFDYGYVRKGYDIMSDSTSKVDVKKYSVYLYNSYSEYTRLIDFDLAFGNEPDTAKFIRKWAKVVWVLPNVNVDPVLYTNNIKARVTDGSNDDFANTMLKNWDSWICGWRKQAGSDYIIYGDLNDVKWKYRLSWILASDFDGVKHSNVMRWANSVFSEDSNKEDK